MFSINSRSWMLETPIDVFFFDCDSTLSLIEGIDYLAGLNGVGKEVEEITHRCMAETGLSRADYKKRLDLVKPTQLQIKQLAATYCTHLAPGAVEVISALHSLGKKIYIISAGIKSAILPLAVQLDISSDRVLAVDVFFNEDGSYARFDEHSELIQANGKSILITNVLKEGERSLLLGDGYSDWEVQSTVTRFVGYAGLCPKVWVREHSDFYIASVSMLSLLALGLTDEEQMNLKMEFRVSYEQGLADIKQGLIHKEEL